MGLDFSMPKILRSVGQRAANYQPSNFENDSTPGELTQSLAAKAKVAHYYLRPLTLTSSNFEAL